MSRLRYEPCPRCRHGGNDSRGDNLVIYPDESSHCFSCGYHRSPSYRGPNESLARKTNKALEEINGATVLPADFSRDVDPAGWRWLLQYGLALSYWKEQGVGYSETHGRLIFPVPGRAPHFSIGRLIKTNEGEEGKHIPKWKVWGNCHSHAERIGTGKTIVLVEDLLSAHKVAATGQASVFPLFGTVVHPAHIKALVEASRGLDEPIRLWLDHDQQMYTKNKALRLQLLLNFPVNVIHTKEDPKSLTLNEIKEILK